MPGEGSGFSADDNSIFFQQFLGPRLYPVEEDDVLDLNTTVATDYETEQNFTDTPTEYEINLEGEEEPLKDALARFQQHLKNNRNRNGNVN